MNNSETLISERLGGQYFGKDEKIYKFEKIKRAKRQAIKENPHIKLIDLGVGEPDDRANDNIIEILYKEAKEKDNRFYADNGIQAFKEAASEYMEKRFNTSLDANSEINHAVGAKSALSMIPFIFINPGDYTITTVPGYPVISTITEYSGGRTFKLPLLKENNFLPDLGTIPGNIKKSKNSLFKLS